jgi:hypothetical protein
MNTDNFEHGRQAWTLTSKLPLLSRNSMWKSRTLQSNLESRLPMWNFANIFERMSTFTQVRENEPFMRLSDYIKQIQSETENEHFSSRCWMISILATWPSMMICCWCAQDGFAGTTAPRRVRPLAGAGQDGQVRAA